MERASGLRLLILSFGATALVILWALYATQVLVWGASAAFFTMAIVASTWYLAERARAPLAGDTADQRPPVVYLRPFGQDRKTGRGLTDLKTAEQRLAAAVEPIGPLTAIGRPGQTLPHLGAARHYVDDHEWHDKVQSLLANARGCILCSGASDSVAWEAQQVVQMMKPRRAIVLLPESEPESQQFRKATAQIFPVPLPDRAALRERRRTRFSEVGPDGGIGGRITFGPGWEPGLRTWTEEPAPTQNFFDWLVEPLLKAERRSSR